MLKFQIRLKTSLEKWDFWLYDHHCRFQLKPTDDLGAIIKKPFGKVICFFLKLLEMFAGKEDWCSLLFDATICEKIEPNLSSAPN